MSRSSNSKKITGGIGARDQALKDALDELEDVEAETAVLAFDGAVDDRLLQTLARAQTEKCVREVVRVLEAADLAKDRLQAASLLVEWGWGQTGVSAGSKLMQRHGISVNVINLSDAERRLQLEYEPVETTIDVPAVLATTEAK